MSYRNPSHYAINMMSSSQSNFNNAYLPNSTFIAQRDTKNMGHMLHNNMNDNVVSEMVTEYTVHVDGIDRDTNIFPNPYKFIVSLGGPSGQNNNESGVPNPRIDVNFKNVKYIKLKYLMLPRNINYDRVVDASGNKTYAIATTKSTILANYRYLLLRIKEISNDKLYSTNDIIKNDCFVIYRDSNYNDAMLDLWFATQPVKIFYDNGLKNLTRLTIEILTPDGEELRVLYNGNVKLSYIELNTDQTEDTPSSDFHTNFYESVQTNMEFELGVCENQLNTQKNYR
jgi:hypothetical protein